MNYRYLEPQIRFIGSQEVALGARVSPTRWTLASRLIGLSVSSAVVTAGLVAMTEDMSLLLLWMNGRGSSRDYDLDPCLAPLTAVNIPEIERNADHDLAGKPSG